MGVFIPDAPDVNAGGAPGLVLSFMYPRYWKRYPDFARKILDVWMERQSLDVILSWQDDAAWGITLGESVRCRQELSDRGCRPCEWLMSKTYMLAAGARDNAPLALQIIEPTLARFLAEDCISRYCIGSEMNLWNTYDSLQAMTDAVAPRVNAIGRNLGVHFSTDVSDWRPNHPGSTFAEYWNPNQGKLMGGLWYQLNPYVDDQSLQNACMPVLERFAGNDLVVSDCGDGHPFDCHAVEISLEAMFAGLYGLQEADRRGSVVLATPPQHGPAGVVKVQGSGNGQMQ